MITIILKFQGFLATSNILDTPINRRRAAMLMMSTVTAGGKATWYRPGTMPIVVGS